MPVKKYTKEQEKELFDSYADAETDDDRAAVIAAFAAKHDKSNRSIIAKLCKVEGLYKARINVSKVTGDKPETKEQMVKRIEVMYNLKGLEGLSVAPKLVLLKMLREAR